MTIKNIYIYIYVHCIYFPRNWLSFHTSGLQHASQRPRDAPTHVPSIGPSMCSSGETDVIDSASFRSTQRGGERQ